MKKETIIRAWRDPEFRETLTSEERAALPECPAGQALTDLDEGELARAVGGALLVALDDFTCLCSRFTGPITLTTTRTTLTTSVQTTRDQTILQLGQVAALQG